MFPPARTPLLLKKVLPSLFWHLPAGEEKCIYLTFDDGPIPELTSWVLDVLKEKGILATFFCVGENARKNPEILAKIRAAGHDCGNHTENHLNGWKVGDKEYFKNIAEASGVLQTRLFRPPYGRIKPSQMKHLRKNHQLIMWSVLTKDYDPTVSPESCLKNALKCKPGDIILFHDNIKADVNLRYALPLFIDEMITRGYAFKTISQGIELKNAN